MSDKQRMAVVTSRDENGYVYYPRSRSKNIKVEQGVAF